MACSDGSENCFAPQVDWVEGVAILAAVCIVVIVGSVNDWQKEAQFKVLNAKKEDRSVTVVRDGVEGVVNIKVRFRPVSFSVEPFCPLVSALILILLIVPLRGRIGFLLLLRINNLAYATGRRRWRYLCSGTWRDHPCRRHLSPRAQRPMRRIWSDRRIRRGAQSSFRGLLG